MLFFASIQIASHIKMYKQIGIKTKDRKESAMEPYLSPRPCAGRPSTRPARLVLAKWVSTGLLAVAGLLGAIPATADTDPWHNSSAGSVSEGDTLSWIFSIDPTLALAEAPSVPEYCVGTGYSISVDPSTLPPGAVEINPGTAIWLTVPGDRGIYTVSARAQWAMRCCTEFCDESPVLCCNTEYFDWFGLGHSLTGRVLTGVHIEAVEPTQAIQVLRSVEDYKTDDGTIVPLVAGKPLRIRVYLSRVPVPTRVRVGGQLTIINSTIDLKSRELTLSPLCDTQSRRERIVVDPGDNCRAIDFYVPDPPPGSGTLTLWVEDTFPQPTSDPSVSYFVQHDEQTLPVTFKPSRALAFGAVNVCSRRASGRWQCLATPVGDLSRNVRQLRDMFPTHEVSVFSTGEQVRLEHVSDINSNGFFTDCYDLDDNIVDPDVAVKCENLAWWPEVARRISLLNKSLNFTEGPLPSIEQYFYGMTALNLPMTCDGACFAGIVNDIPSDRIQPFNGAVSITNGAEVHPTVVQSTVAHEVGHLLDRRHTNTKTPEVSCFSAVDNQTDWPYTDNYLRSGPGEDEIEVGMNARMGTVIGPTDGVFDIMSYCTTRWISPFTYIQLQKQLELPLSTMLGTDTLATAQGRDVQQQKQNPKRKPKQKQLALPLSTTPGVDTLAAAQGLYWLVSGTIGANEVDLNPVFTLETTGPTAPNDPGVATHVVAVLDALGEPIFWRFFTPSSAAPQVIGGDSPDPGPPVFAELLPVEAAGKHIVVADATENILVQLPLGGSAPVVVITTPAGGETLTGDYTMTWTGTDPDSSELIYWVQYSHDGGATWSTLTQAATTNALDIDFTGLQGTDGGGRLRVLASDGVNTGVATSQPFSVAKGPPAAEILHPEPDAHLALGEPILLEGYGYDPDDGNLPDAALQWTSSLDGLLGSGAEIAIDTLSEGSHLISLSVTDSDGNPASAEVTLNVIPVNLSETREDADEDGVADHIDTCLNLANPDQRDTDIDGFGNMCDCDLNQDEFCGDQDFSLFIGCYNAATNGDPICEAADMNGDGFVGGPDFSLFIGGYNGPPGPSAVAAAE